MTWTPYRIVFKLKSPMHIGCGKVGNVQRTRPYVTGRVFWGALTMRLTREHHQPATDSRLYQAIGEQVHQQLAYTYFYPATKANGDYKIHLPWENEHLFRRQFLSSYASTALNYPQQSADEGLLHEVEFISPRTLDSGEQVYLVGYVFAKNSCKLDWKMALCQLQLGGERGYGWGGLIPVFPKNQKEFKPLETNKLFCGEATFEATEDRPIIKPTERLLAHTVPANVSVQGEIEPLVGREWTESSGAGEHVAFSSMCWIPGSRVEKVPAFQIGNFGIWQVV